MVPAGSWGAWRPDKNTKLTRLTWACVSASCLPSKLFVVKVTVGSKIVLAHQVASSHRPKVPVLEGSVVPEISIHTSTSLLAYTIHVVVYSPFLFKVSEFFLFPALQSISFISFDLTVRKLWSHHFIFWILFGFPRSIIFNIWCVIKYFNINLNINIIK